MPDILPSTLSGRGVVIVGGGTGIGAGVARLMHAHGANVFIGGRRSEPLDAVAASVDDGSPIRSHTVDVADDDSVNEFFAAARQQLGRIDVMVNCAGINIQKRRMSDMDPADWQRVMNINAGGGYRCMHAVLAEMRDRGDGLIVNVSSIAGKRAIELGGVVYCASKFAMTALGTVASNEVREEGVRITNVYPGEVNTPILDNRPTPVSQEHRDSILQPEDVAEMIVAIAMLPPRAHVPEIVIKPLKQEWC